MTRMVLLAALALACVASTAFAAEVATVGDKAVILPWGDWLVALAVSLREPILTILLPIIAAYIIQAIRKVYPWAALFLSQQRVEMMLEVAVGFGLNAVTGRLRQARARQVHRQRAEAVLDALRQGDDLQLHGADV